MKKEVTSVELEKKLYSRNFKKYGMDMNPAVGLTTGIFILIFGYYSAIANQ
ncbi:MAG: hypothetical protein ACI8WT_005151 [Clostridium sp.]|jgi:hypothetical protein